MSIDQQNLPALVSSASRRLAAATSSAEILDARDLASVAYDAAKKAARLLAAKGAHDALISAAHRAQADALEIEAAAKRRLADEYDAAQERGEVAALGTNQHSEGVAASYTLGLRRDQIQEARQLRDAERDQPGITRETLNRALEDGHEPSKSLILAAAQRIRMVKQMERREARDQLLTDLSMRSAPMPEDRQYPIIYADPPWQYDFSPSTSRSVENHYPTMPIEKILALPVERLATESAMLFLWAPPSFIQKGLHVLEAWGFELASSMVWVKDRAGTGIYFRQRHEYLLLGKRGKPITPTPGTQADSVLEIPRSRHSAKPAETYDIIEQMYPNLPKIELFSRSPRDGWVGWGYESDGG